MIKKVLVLSNIIGYTIGIVTAIMYLFDAPKEPEIAFILCGIFVWGLYLSIKDYYAKT